MNQLWYVHLCTTFACAIQCFSAQSYDSSFSLLKDLFGANRTNYDPLIRPLVNQSDTLFVEVTFDVISIVEMNEDTQTFTVNGLLKLQWNDEIIRWNPFNYGNVTSIHPAPSQIWTPQIKVLNKNQDITSDDNDPLLVSHDGNVTRVLSGFFSTSCPMDFEKYPHDKQTCVIEIVSLTLSSEEMQFIVIINEMYSYQHFPIQYVEWELTAAHVDTSFKYTVGTIVSSIKLSFTLKRKSPQYILYITILISNINVIPFIIPTESKEKINFSVTLFLSFTVLAITAISSTPKSSLSQPYFTLYVYFLLLISSFTMLVNIFVHIVIKNEGKKAKKFKRGVLYLAAMCDRAFTRHNKVTDKSTARKSQDEAQDDLTNEAQNKNTAVNLVQDSQDEAQDDFTNEAQNKNIAVNLVQDSQEKTQYDNTNEGQRKDTALSRENNADEQRDKLKSKQPEKDIVASSYINLWGLHLYLAVWLCLTIILLVYIGL